MIACRSFSHTYTAFCHKLLRVKTDGRWGVKATLRKRQQSFKQQITLIAKCVNIEIQYMSGCERSTLINDVWCGFTNYIFQAFNSRTRLIAKGKLFECGKLEKVLIFFLLITLAPLINYVNWIRRAFLVNAYWKFHSKWKYIILLFPFLRLLLPSSLEIPLSL